MTSMVLGDGVLTPAQSVLGAIYGLQVKTSVSQGVLALNIFALASAHRILFPCTSTRYYQSPTDRLAQSQMLLLSSQSGLSVLQA